MVFVVKTLHGSTTYKNPPNGGWGWVVVFASFCISGITFSIAKGISVFYVELQNDLKLNNSQTSLIFSALFGMISLGGLLVTPFKNKLDDRQFIMISGVISAVGLVIFSLSYSAELLVVATAISGTGSGIAIVHCMGQISLYFSTWRSLANSIFLAGGAITATLFPFVASRLLDSYGWRGAILILAAVSLNVSMFASLIQPIQLVNNNSAKTDDSPQQPHKSSCSCGDVKSFFSKYWVGLLLLLSISILTLSWVTPVFYVIPTAKQIGFSSAQASVLFSLLSVGDIVARPLTGFMISHFPKIQDNILLVAGVAVMCQSLLQVIPACSHSWNGMVFYCIGYGVVYGSIVVMGVVAVPILMGQKNITTYFAINSSAGAVSSCVSGLLSGALVDHFGTYDAAYWYTCVCMGLCSAVILTCYVIVKRRGAVVLKPGDHHADAAAGSGLVSPDEKESRV